MEVETHHSPMDRGQGLSQPLHPKGPLIFTISPGHHAIEGRSPVDEALKEGFVFHKKGN